MFLCCYRFSVSKDLYVSVEFWLRMRRLRTWQCRRRRRWEVMGSPALAHAALARYYRYQTAAWWCVAIRLSSSVGKLEYASARLVFRLRRYDHVSCLNDLVRVADLPGRRRLRSSSSHQLLVPPFRLTTVGRRTFPVAASLLCNSLPSDIQSSPSLAVFRQRLKTFLFRQSFPSIILWFTALSWTSLIVLLFIATLKIVDWHWHWHTGRVELNRLASPNRSYNFSSRHNPR